jgi:SNF2 family DNA or RNA helicase
MLRDEQIELRRQRAKAGRYAIENLGKNRVFSNYRVTNTESGGQYVVGLRGFSVGDNTCTCPDYRANTLGTCKHIELVQENLKGNQPAHVQRKKAPITVPELYLHYGETLELGLHVPPRHTDQLGKLAKRYFNERGLWSGRGRYEDFLDDANEVPEPINMVNDALEFLDREIERDTMAKREAEWLKLLDDEALDWKLLNIDPYPYQWRGAIFLACRGRCILGDDMGLGKTIQAMAAVEILARERGLGRVLVIAPSSVKYQWDTEIRKFTKRAVQVIDGTPEERAKQYAEPTFYRLVNYEQVVRDTKAIQDWKPDVIILDEAQRIKNWASKTTMTVKKLQSRYAIVLTGTPLENKLEELYSIVQFVDERRFGPAFQFLHDHRVLDDKGQLTGYRQLDKIRDRLTPIFLRRTRDEVLGELPPRTDSNVFVELSDDQRMPYEEQRTTLARLLSKPTLTDADRKRILACLSNLRLICDSTFLFDKSTNSSPKLVEFEELLNELGLLGAGRPKHKVVVFSQWEQMLHLCAAVLERQRLGYALLHGGLSGKERKAALATFKNDDACKVFLSTDAGGVGLNLQMADTVINLELPWNPAVLEQRIARVHRLGQEKPVRVINLVTRGTVEERVQRILADKQQLFDGLFDGEEDELNITGVNPAGFRSTVQQLLGEALPIEVPLPVGMAASTEWIDPVLTALESLVAGLTSANLNETQRHRVQAMALMIQNALTPP